MCIQVLYITIGCRRESLRMIGESWDVWNIGDIGEVVVCK